MYFFVGFFVFARELLGAGRGDVLVDIKFRRGEVDVPLKAVSAGVLEEVPLSQLAQQLCFLLDLILLDELLSPEFLVELLHHSNFNILVYTYQSQNHPQALARRNSHFLLYFSSIL